jgi:hypothetical protein
MFKDAKAWERIEFRKPKDDAKGDPPPDLYRLPVPSGWLIACDWGGSPGPLVFVPDANHEWDPLK